MNYNYNMAWLYFTVCSTFYTDSQGLWCCIYFIILGSWFLLIFMADPIIDVYVWDISNMTAICSGGIHTF